MLNLKLSGRNKVSNARYGLVISNLPLPSSVSKARNLSPFDWVFRGSGVEDGAAPRRAAEGFDRREVRRSPPVRPRCDYAPPCVLILEIFDR